MHTYSSVPTMTSKPRSWLSWLDRFSFGPFSYFVTSVVLVSFLLASYCALAVLWATDALSSRHFDISRVDALSQIVVGSSQTLIIITTAILSFLVHQLASDSILRRRKSKPVHMLHPITHEGTTGQSVAALHDSLSAWRGPGSSLISLWRSRRMHVAISLRIATVLLFFSAISTLQLVSPTAIGVDTTNSTTTVSLDANRMAINNASIPALFNISEHVTINSRVLTALGSLPYVWEQRNSSVGAPPGFNGT